MKRVSWSTWFFIAFWVFAVPWFGPLIYKDVVSPELWNDWMHDPRWYGPVLIISIGATAVIFVVALLDERRWNRMTPEERYEEAVRRLSKGRRR